MFNVLALLVVVFAVGVVAFNNPVRSALSLVGAFFVLALIYFSLNAQLLAISQVMVYAGAIMVLFLFVIMLLSATSPSYRRIVDRKPVVGLVGSAALVLIIGSQIISPLVALAPAGADPAFGTPQWIGRTLFTGYVWPFEIASVLLLVGLVGSIVLAKRRIGV